MYTVLEDHLIYHCFKKICTILQKQTHRLRERTYGCQWEGWGERIVREFGTDRYTLLYFKWITNKDCTAHGTPQNVMWQPGWEGSLGENGYCICMAESLCHPPEMITTLLITVFQYKIKSLKNRYSFNSKV